MKPGDLVVCIYHFQPCDCVVCRIHKFPVKDKVYTLRTIAVEQGDLVVRLDEIINPEQTWLNGITKEMAFTVEAFRKIDYNKAAISELEYATETV